MSEILKKTCPKCGKEIISLYLEQLEQNYKVHLMNCKDNNNNNNKNNNSDENNGT